MFYLPQYFQKEMEDERVEAEREADDDSDAPSWQPWSLERCCSRYKVLRAVSLASGDSREAVLTMAQSPEWFGRIFGRSIFAQLPISLYVYFLQQATFRISPGSVLQRSCLDCRSCYGTVRECCYSRSSSVSIESFCDIF